MSPRKPLVAMTALVVAALIAGVPGTHSARAKSQPERGGKVIAHKAAGKSARPVKGARGVLYRTGYGSIEPTIGVDEDKNLFMVAMGGLGSDVIKSTNGGKTWDLASPVIAGQKVHVITLDPYIYMDESTGRLFDIDLTVACSYMSFSDDGGSTWTTNPLACGRPVNDHQTLFGGPPAISPMTGYPEVLYYCWNDFSLGTSCSKSVDGGISWLPEGQAFFGFEQSDQGEPVGRRCGGFNGHGVVGDDGTVYLPKEHCGQPWLGISRDEGLSWEQVQVATNTTERLGSDTSVAIDDKGNLYYVYETKRQELYLVTSEDGGSTWSRPLLVQHPAVNEVTLPTLDVGKPGRIAIGYMASTNSPFAKCRPDCEIEDYNHTTWNGYITVTDNALAKSPTFYSAATNLPSDPLYRGRCDFTTRCGPILDFMDIEISPNGLPYAAYIDACTELCVEGGSPASDGEGVVGSLIGIPRLR